MLRWDFRYIETHANSRRLNHTQLSSAVAPDAYKERYRVKRRRFPWLAVILIVVCIWCLAKVVFG